MGMCTLASWQDRLYSPLRVRKWEPWSQVKARMVSSYMPFSFSFSTTRARFSSSRRMQP